MPAAPPDLKETAPFVLTAVGAVFVALVVFETAETVLLKAVVAACVVAEVVTAATETAPPLRAHRPAGTAAVITPAAAVVGFVAGLPDLARSSFMITVRGQMGV